MPGPSPEIPYTPVEAQFVAAQQAEMQAARATGLAAIKQKLAEIVFQVQLAFQRVKERIVRKKKNDPGAFSDKFDGEVTDTHSENHAVRITQARVQEAIRIYKEDAALIPVKNDTSAGQVVHRLIAEIQVAEVNHITAPFIHSILDRVTRNPSIDPLKILDADELAFLKEANPGVAAKVIDTMLSVAGSSETEIRAFKAKVDQVKIENQIPPEPKKEPEKEKPKQRQELKEDIIDERFKIAHDFEAFANRLQEPRDRDLVDAFRSPRKFDSYIGGLAEEKVRELGRGEGVTYDDLTDTEKTKIGQKVSEELSQKVKLLIGKIFRKVDESSPEEFWEESSKEGSFMDNTDLAANGFLQQLENLRFATYEDYKWVGNKKIQFFKQDEVAGDVATQTKAQYEDVLEPFQKRTAEGARRYVSPFYNYKQVEFQNYFLTVYNGAKDEIGIRKFLHNATALQYQPPPEGGYYAQLAKYAETLLPSSATDIMSSLPDADAIYSASQLEDKLLEADFAKYNWIHSQTMSQLDMETKMTTRSKQTLEYLHQLYPDLQEDDWRYKRALIMGIGDNHSIALKTIEHGARADAPRNIHDGSPNNASYDKKDYMPYMALNPFNHFNLRYGLDSTLMGNLLFLPVEGEGAHELGNLHKWWDHNDLIHEMKQSMNSYVAGRDTDKKTRIIDYTNLGRAGSIYTRGAWRKYHAYEAFLDRTGDNRVLNTWKNVENIGIEIVKDLVDKRIPELDGEFYKTGGEARRREMVDYLYKKYFKQGDVIPDDAEVTRKFAELEAAKHEPDKLGKAYRTFYYQTITRAMRQRIPTKFLRYERNREVYGRERAWEEVRQEVHMDIPTYELAVKDLCAAEVMERREATKQLNGVIKGMRAKGHLALDDVHKIYRDTPTAVTYELNEAKIRRYLETEMKLPADRIERALDVYRKTMEFTERTERGEGGKSGDKYLDHFAHKYEHEHFPYAMAVEELERTFLAQRGAGERAPARAFADIGFTEEKTCKVFANYFEKLKDVATNGKHDFSELVHDIETAKQQIMIDIDPEYAHKLAHHMSALTISFFKKDTIARNRLTNMLFSHNRKNSLAAEFTGLSRGVWEWEVREIADFINALEARHVLPTEPYKVGKPPEYEKKQVGIPIPFTKKKIPLFNYMARKPDTEWYGGKLRKEFGGSNVHIALELLNKFLPILIAYVLYKYISEAIKESEGKKE